MGCYPKTPQDLIRARFSWLRRADFSDIYHSYHADSRFREHFPTEDEYLRFAVDQQLAEIELLQLQLIDEQLRGKLAKILTFQAYSFQGQPQYYLDITTLRLHNDHWQVLFGKRVACEPDVELEMLSWDAVDGHPESIIY